MKIEITEKEKRLIYSKCFDYSYQLNGIRDYCDEMAKYDYHFDFLFDLIPELKLNYSEYLKVISEDVKDDLDSENVTEIYKDLEILKIDIVEP